MLFFDLKGLGWFSFSMVFGSGGRLFKESKSAALVLAPRERCIVAMVPIG
jgi:hypothetical protein